MEDCFSLKIRKITEIIFLSLYKYKFVNYSATFFGGLIKKYLKTIDYNDTILRTTILYIFMDIDDDVINFSSAS